MPLFEPQKKPDSGRVNPNIKPSPYKDIAVDSKHVDLRDLITHVEGMKWVLPGYYSQYVTAETELASQEVTREDVYQQYLLIKHMELRVTQPLSGSYDQTSGEWTYQGESNMYPGLVPNVGDMFLADIGDGRVGIFTLTEKRRLSILQDSAYQITYTFTNFAEPRLIDDLNAKVTKTQIFVREFISNNRNPYLVESEYETYLRLEKYMHTLPDMYYDLFYNQEYGTLLIPDQSADVYDPFVVNFFKSIISMERHPRVVNIRSIHCDTHRSVAYRTLYDALLRRDDNVLDTADLKLARFYSKTLSHGPQYGGIRFSGIEQFYFPFKDEDVTAVRVDAPLAPSKPRTFSRPVPLHQWIVVTDVGGAQTREVPVIYPVTEDDWYVLSSHFYLREDDQTSMLEIMVNQRLGDIPNDIDKLFQVVDAAETWGRVEQFYYYPILMYLLICAMGDIN